MKLATWSLANPLPSAIFFIVMSIAGGWGFHHLTLQNLPDVELPTVTVVISQPGVTPSQLESQIARKAENALATIQYLKHMRTSISDGVVTIDCEFEIRKSLTDALIESKDAIGRIRQELPQAIQEPIIKAILASNQPIVTYTVSNSTLDEETLSWLVDNELNKVVSHIPGVGRFERIGGVSREVKVILDPLLLASLNVSPTNISEAIKSAAQDASAGKILNTSEQSIRAKASFSQVEELGELPIALPDGNYIKLNQVGKIVDGPVERSQMAILEGAKVVAFKIYRAKGYDEAVLAEQIKAVLKKFTNENDGFDVQLVHSNVEYTLQQYEGSMRMIYEGIALSLIVVFLFLRDIRATLVSTIAIPLSILPTFALMYWFGFSLNSITLLALAMVIGILIDDAIVEIENIDNYLSKYSSHKAAVEAAVNDIAVAVIATTLALIVVFLPTALMPGISGLFFKEFGWTASIAVFVSLLVARMIIPVLASVFLKKKEVLNQTTPSLLIQRYRALLEGGLRHKRIVVIGFVVIFIASLSMVPFIPKGFIPASDRGYVSVNFELQPGSTMYDSENIEKLAREKIQSLRISKRVFSTIGGVQSGSRGAKFAGESRRGNLTILLQDGISQLAAERSISSALKNVAGAKFSLAQASPGGKLTLILTSETDANLKNTAIRVLNELGSVAGLTNITSVGLLDRPEIAIRPNFELAATLGVATDHIAETVRLLTIGQYEELTPKLYLEDRQIPIQVKFFNPSVNTMEDLKSFPIQTPHGFVPLESITDIQQVTGPATINRYDRKRYISISADLIGLPLGEALNRALHLPSIIGLPKNISLATGGDEETMAELGRGFKMAVVIGVLGLYCLLVILFKDMVQPFIILCAIPLSLGGAFAALMLFGSMLCLPSMIGIIMLVGIVTKNSILIVEQAEKYYRAGFEPHAAVIEACLKRAKPIIMTTCAMVAGMIPICFGLGDDATFRQPMAFSVIGGLIFSTMLSLVFVPALYVYSKRAKPLY